MASAAPEADPQLLYGLGYHHPAITSIGAFTTYTNGAVVPTNTPAVAAATAAHLQAKAGVYAAHGYLPHLLGKRDAEAKADADPYLLYGHGLYGYPYGLGLGYGTYPAVTSVGGLTTYSNGAVVPTDPANQAATAAHLASKGYVHLLGKREAEAEAEADPEAWYGYAGYHAYPYGYGYGYAGYAGVPYAGAYGFTHYPNGAVVPTDPANQLATAQHLSYKFGHGLYGLYGR